MYKALYMEKLRSPLDPRRDTRARVLKHIKDGLTPREISKLLDISTQRVYQILQELDAAGELDGKGTA